MGEVNGGSGEGGGQQQASGGSGEGKGQEQVHW